MAYKPTPPDLYQGNQVIINSDRLLFNAKDDSIFLFSKESIGFSANGSIHFDTSEVKDVFKPKEYQDYELKLKKNEILYIDLYDNVERDTLYLLYRDITIYYRDNDVRKEYYNSDNNTIIINGNFVKKVIVHKPELK